MRVSVIVPTFNRAEYLRLALASLVEQSCPAHEFEVLVVDNDSTDDTRYTTEQVIQALPQPSIRYIHEPIPGLLAGRHRGAKEARGDLLVFIDDDIIADSGWLLSIVQTFADPAVQLVGGRNLPRYEVPPPAWLDGFWRTTPYGGRTCGYLSLLDLGEEILDINAIYVWGLNFAIRRRALLDLGGFHPDCIPDHLQHFQGDGESGLTMKAAERGYRAVYLPKALVYHNVPAQRLTAEYFERRAFYQGVCDSYTNIRRARGIPATPGAPSLPQPSARSAAGFLRRLPSYARHPLQHGRRFARRLLGKQRAMSSRLGKASEHSVVVQRVHAAYRAGYEFHHAAVAQGPALLHWVLREDYWDYRLPVEASRSETPHR
jgi:glycosyltransferase involved in cell wall biosynthesis